MSTSSPLIFNLAPTTTTSLSYQSFLVIFIAITLSSILIVLYTDFIKNLAYGTIGLNNNSTWHALILALVVTGLFILVIYLINYYGLIPSGASAASTLTGSSFPPGANSLGSSNPTTLLNSVKNSSSFNFKSSTPLSKQSSSSINQYRSKFKTLKVPLMINN